MLGMHSGLNVVTQATEQLRHRDLEQWRGSAISRCTPL